MLINKPKIKNILLVDDDEIVNFFNKTVISRAVYTENITISRDGIEALDYLQSSINDETPDLIMLDINMPRMDGWQFLDEYKNIKQNLKKHPVIIMLSSSNNSVEIEKARNSGEISAFKNKPLTGEKFQEIIDQFSTLFTNTLEEI
ncbi:response regulator [Chondrinema litorale]|uniref:response regulator n=1 Tax=Chondrinema litorale TaxID=2994555 RepID=UPI0025437599|nr:response regulator [Chondrinema litorale]UZR97734.1 response regulator [Chondrinema litorale]